MATQTIEELMEGKVAKQCNRCKGTGKQGQTPCWRCKGTGIMYKVI